MGDFGQTLEDVKTFVRRIRQSTIMAHKFKDSQRMHAYKPIEIGIHYVK